MSILFCSVLIWGAFLFKGYCVSCCCGGLLCWVQTVTWKTKPLYMCHCHLSNNLYQYSLPAISSRTVVFKTSIFPPLKELLSYCTVLYSPSSGYCLFHICDPYCWSYCNSLKKQKEQHAFSHKSASVQKIQFSCHWWQSCRECWWPTMVLLVRLKNDALLSVLWPVL